MRFERCRKGGFTQTPHIKLVGDNVRLHFPGNDVVTGKYTGK